MKKTAIRFGLYGVYVILALMILHWLMTNNREPNYERQEIVTWSGIVLSVIFVYFGLKYYRDHQNGGRLTFGEGLKLGLLIVLLPAIAFGVFNVLYIMFIDTNFTENYYNYQLSEIRASTPAADLDKKLKEAADDKEMFSNPGIQFISMFICVFAVGLIATVISTLLLKRAKPAASYS
jgi:hypothetical protein